MRYIVLFCNQTDPFPVFVLIIQTVTDYLCLQRLIMNTHTSYHSGHYTGLEHARYSYKMTALSTRPAVSM